MHAGAMGFGDPQGLQPMQIIFQQGLGNLAQVLPAMMTMPGGVDGMTGATMPAGTDPTGGVAGAVLPWRYLRRLHQHLARLLGRSNQHRNLMPSNMVGGELFAFLGVLLQATNELSVAIGELQNSIAESGGPQPRHRLQFAMALVAAARTFRGLAVQIQSGFEGGDAFVGENGAMPVPTEEPLVVEGPSVPSAEVVSQDPPAAGASSDSEEGARAPPSDSSQGHEAVVAEGARTEVQAGLTERAVLEDVVAILNDGVDDDSAEFADADGGDITEVLLGPDSAQMLQMPSPVLMGDLEQFIQPMVGSSGSGMDADGNPSIPSVNSILGQLLEPTVARSGSVGDTDDSLSSLPPDVVANWQRWAQAESFGRSAIAQASQPPLSEAYLSGDATGSHHGPAFPDPEDYLDFRWRTATGYTDEAPETPEHLSRTYLSAFVRDLGRHVGSDATFASIPDARQRYPHLAQLATLFAPERSAG